MPRFHAVYRDRSFYSKEVEHAARQITWVEAATPVQTQNRGTRHHVRSQMQSHAKISLSRSRRSLDELRDSRPVLVLDSSAPVSGERQI